MLTEETEALPALRGKATSFILEGGMILDVACGSGGNAPWLVGRGRYVGTDLSHAGLRHAKRKGLCLLCADAEALPFRDESFDAVISTFALEHSADPVRMLSEMRRVVKAGCRIVLLGPTWDLPFWYPNSLRSRAGSLPWRLTYTLRRLAGQIKACLLGRMPFLIIDEPDCFRHPFIYDSDAVYVVWSHEVIRQMERWGCRLAHCEVDDRLLGSSFPVRLLKRLLILLPLYRYAGSTLLMVFER
jgi:SAM-dependent methyltransferase